MDATRNNRGVPRRALVLSGGGGRGGYQVGVCRFLEKQNWYPDLVCGTSVGSLNAAGITMGWSADRMAGMWLMIERNKIFEVPFRRRLKHGFRKLTGRARRFEPAFDTRPLRDLLEGIVDTQKIRASQIELVVAATQIVKGRLDLFTNEEITVDHLMASCAIPIVFPWQVINGEPYWDGGILANTPILPALERHAEEIIVVLMTPFEREGGELPKRRREATEWALELSWAGSVVNLIMYLMSEQGLEVEEQEEELSQKHFITVRGTRIAVVAPKNLLRFQSVLTFKPTQSRELIEAGYADAAEQLQSFFGNAKVDE